MKTTLKDILTKDFDLATKLLDNRQLREWVDYEKDSKQAYYELRYKHRLEIDRLRFNQTRDPQALADLNSSHHRQREQLDKDRENVRLEIEKRHRKEKAKLIEYAGNSLPQ